MWRVIRRNRRREFYCETDLLDMGVFCEEKVDSQECVVVLLRDTEVSILRINLRGESRSIGVVEDFQETMK